MNRTQDDLKRNSEMVRIFQCSILNKYFTLYIYICTRPWETSGFAELYRWKKQLMCMGIELTKLLEIAIFFIGILTLGSNQSLFSTILSA